MAHVIEAGAVAAIVGGVVTVVAVVAAAMVVVGAVVNDEASTPYLIEVKDFVVGRSLRLIPPVVSRHDGTSVTEQLVGVHLCDTNTQQHTHTN